MNNNSKRRIIYNVLEQNEIFRGNRKIIDLLANDIYAKTPAMFGISDSKNEIFNHLKTILQNSALKIKEETKEAFNAQVEETKDPFDIIEDPKSLMFDISDENEYLKRMLSKLFELDNLKPDKNYLSVFYKRYIKNSDCESIADELKITAKELNNRILEMVKFINRE